MEYLATHNQQVIAEGDIKTVVLAIKDKLNETNVSFDPVVIEIESFKRIEINWQDNTENILNQFATCPKDAPNKRGRPKLGVISKEVTLLPRHWEWLATQRGGASVALRRLVDEATKNTSIEDLISIEQKRLDSFIMTIFGDEPGFEEASRALYRNSRVSFEASIKKWPAALRIIIMKKFFYIADLHNGKIKAGLS